MTLQPNLDQINSPAEFVDALNQARVWAGNPSLRELEKRSGHEYSHSTFRNVLRGPGLPKMWQMLALISALGLKDDECMWATAWRRIALGKTNRPHLEETL